MEEASGGALDVAFDPLDSVSYGIQKYDRFFIFSQARFMECSEIQGRRICLLDFSPRIRYAKDTI